MTLRDLLSAREFDVVTLVAQGLLNKEIATRLHLTEHTVKNYMCKIADKTNLDNRVKLAVRFVREELAAQEVHRAIAV